MSNNIITDAPPPCQYCPAPATSNVETPLCMAHLDVVILADYMTAKNEPLTLDNARQIMHLSQQTKNGWTISLDDLERLWPQVIAEVAHA